MRLLKDMLMYDKEVYFSIVQNIKSTRASQGFNRINVPPINTLTSQVPHIMPSSNTTALF